MQITLIVNIRFAFASNHIIFNQKGRKCKGNFVLWLRMKVSNELVENLDDLSKWNSMQIHIFDVKLPTV
jgi:hypothetical protein